MSTVEPVPPPPPPSGGLMSTIAQSSVQALRNSPGLLVVAVVNVTVLWMLFSATRDAIGRRDKQFMYVLERCSSVHPQKE